MQTPRKKRRQLRSLSAEAAPLALFRASLPSLFLVPLSLHVRDAAEARCVRLAHEGGGGIICLTLKTAITEEATQSATTTDATPYGWSATTCCTTMYYSWEASRSFAASLCGILPPLCSCGQHPSSPSQPPPPPPSPQAQCFNRQLGWGRELLRSYGSHTERNIKVVGRVGVRSGNAAPP